MHWGGCCNRSFLCKYVGMFSLYVVEEGCCSQILTSPFLSHLYFPSTKVADSSEFLLPIRLELARHDRDLSWASGLLRNCISLSFACECKRALSIFSAASVTASPALQDAKSLYRRFVTGLASSAVSWASRKKSRWNYNCWNVLSLEKGMRSLRIIVIICDFY